MRGYLIKAYKIIKGTERIEAKKLFPMTEEPESKGVTYSS